MTLPDSAHARIDEEKLTTYLLSETHPVGRGKAAFFVRYGFSLANWQELRQALLTHGAGQPTVQQSATAYGMRYIVEGPLETPNGRVVQVRSVWIVDSGASVPRLVTAYPL